MTFHRRAAWLLLALAAGCGRSWVYDVAIPRPCTLEFKPQVISYGLVQAGEALTGRVDIWNAGDVTCQVSQVALAASSDPDFLLPAGQTTAITLAAGADASLYVDFEASTLTPPTLKKGTLTFLTGDPAKPTASVPLLASIPVIPGQQGPYSAGWPKWHNDNTDQGQSAANTSGDVGQLVWKFNVGSPPVSTSTFNPAPTYMNSPVVDGLGNVYQLAMDGTFYAISPAGKQLWQTTLLPPNPDEHPATPIIAADGTIYVETGTDSIGTGLVAQLYHLGSKDGSILFEAGPPTGGNCITGNTCITDNDCESNNCQNGNCCFNADGFDVNPSLGNGGLLFDGDDFGQIVTYTLDPSGTFTQANEVILQFFGERVAVALDQNDQSYWCSGTLCYGVTAPAAGFAKMPAWPSSGAPNGTSPLGDLPSTWTNSDLAFDKSFTGWLMVETGSQKANLGMTQVVAMDPKDGAFHWTQTLPFGVTPGSFDSETDVGIFSSDVGNSAPAIDAYDGTVYVGNVDGLYALVGATGAIKAGFPFLTVADVDSAPAIGGDRTVFFGTSDGVFYAVNPDGTERYRFTTGGRISSSPAIGPDGTVFFVSDDGFLYALR